MKDEKTKLETCVGEIHKRREKMADGRRYIIYYTFEKTEEDSIKTTESEAIEENV